MKRSSGKNVRRKRNREKRRRERQRAFAALANDGKRRPLTVDFWPVAVGGTKYKIPMFRS